MDQALSPGFVPFTFALGLMLAILLLELVALLLGLSLHGSEPDLDISPAMADLQATFDLPSDATPDVQALLHASCTLDNATLTEPDAGLLALIGLGRVPLLIWIAAMLFSFGLAGFVLQGMASSVLGRPLAAILAIPVALATALCFSRAFAGGFAHLIPKLETTATSAQFMGGLRGVVTQGTARAGSAAEVRLRDRFGNMHHMRCEPFRDEDVIPEGTEVLTLREKLGPDRWGLRILPIS